MEVAQEIDETNYQGQFSRDLSLSGEWAEEIGEDIDEYGLADAEPKLNYKRLKFEVNNIIQKASITCFAAHSKFITIGTSIGSVHVLDLIGSPIANGSYNSHSNMTVIDISLTNSADFLASCGEDKQIVVCQIGDPVPYNIIRLDYKIRAVAISPIFANTYSLITGNTKLMIISKGMISKNKTEELYKSNDVIQNIKWRGDLVLWADQRNVRVFDMKAKISLGYLNFEPSMNCHLKWVSDDLFIVAWIDSITIAGVKTMYQSETERKISAVENISSKISVTSKDSSQGVETPTSSKFHGRPSIVGSIGLGSSPAHNLFQEPNRKIVKVFHKFQLKSNEIICGVTVHDNNLLIMLFPSSKQNQNDINGQKQTNISKNYNQPSILLAEVGDILIDTTRSINHFLYPDGYHIISKEEIALRSFDSSPNAKNFSIGSIPHENTHYIVSPKDIACAERPTIADRVKWRFNQQYFKQAVELARQHVKELLVGRNECFEQNWSEVLDNLLENGHSDTAAEMCPILLRTNAEWEQEVHKFIHLNELKAIAPHIPLALNAPVLLSMTTYEVILTHIMRQDPEYFFQLISSWPNNNDRLYNHQSMISAVTSYIETDQSKNTMSSLDQLSEDVRYLLQALAILYEQSGMADKAVEIFIRLKNAKVFELIARHLYSPNLQIRSKVLKVFSVHVEQLMDLNTEIATKFLLDQLDLLSVNKVIDQLEHRSLLLYTYLDKVYQRKPQLLEPHFILLLNLYAKHDHKRIKVLLRSSDNYPLAEALQICEENHFIQETAYLLTRIGKRKDALKLLMRKGGNDFKKNDGEQPTIEERQKAAAHESIKYLREQEEQSVFESQYSNSGPSVNSNLAELWQIVIEFAVDKPAFICALLEQAGTEGFDPRVLLKQIKPGTEIVGVQKSLTKLMNDYQVHIEIRESCNEVLFSDLYNSYEKLLSDHNYPILIQPESDSSNFDFYEGVLHVQSSPCHICGSIVLFKCNPETEADWAVFNCKHVFHGLCLKNLPANPMQDTAYQCCYKPSQSLI